MCKRLIFNKKKAFEFKVDKLSPEREAELLKEALELGYIRFVPKEKKMPTKYESILNMPKDVMAKFLSDLVYDFGGDNIKPERFERWLDEEVGHVGEFEGQRGSI